MPKHGDFGFQRSTRSEQPDQDVPDQSAKIAHRSNYRPIRQYQSAAWVCGRDRGHDGEFWQIFKKYQIPVLNRQKELGYVISYTVYRPNYHTGEDTRWEYRIVVAYKNLASSRYGREVTKQLFPDQGTLNREDNRRWELTEAHYDLPIRIIDPNGDGDTQ